MYLLQHPLLQLFPLGFLDSHHICRLVGPGWMTRGLELVTGPIGSLKVAGSKNLMAPVMHSRSCWELVSRECSRTPPPHPLPSCTSSPCPLHSPLPAGKAGQPAPQPLWTGRGSLLGRGRWDKWTPVHPAQPKSGGRCGGGGGAPY